MSQTFQELVAKYNPNQKPILPVIVIKELAEAVPLAQTLVANGINFLEITLRTEHGLEAIRQIKQAVPEACVGAGTVVTPEQYQNCIDAGAEFIISPGLTPALAQLSQQFDVPYLPGISSASDLMTALEYGLKELKFFPAEQAGGVAMLKALSAPFPDIMFCPTGGINEQKSKEYLALDCVMAVGGSWVCPK